MSVSLNQNFQKSKIQKSKIFQNLWNWQFNGKWIVNANPGKKARELLFSRKVSSKSYASFHFNDNFVHQVQLQNHLGLFFDSKLSFDEYIQWIKNKTFKRTELVRKFIRLSLEFTLILKTLLGANKESFQNKLETVQNNAALAITGAIKGSSRKKKLPVIKSRFLKVTVMVPKIMLVFQSFKKCTSSLCTWYNSQSLINKDYK